VAQRERDRQMAKESRFHDFIARPYDAYTPAPHQQLGAAKT